MAKNNILKKLGAISLLLMMLQSTTSCSKQMECDIKEKHAHKRISTNGYISYYPGEDEYINGYQWTTDTILINERQEKMLRFIGERGYINIFDNVDSLKLLMEANKPYQVYEYTYYKNEIIHYKDSWGAETSAFSSYQYYYSDIENDFIWGYKNNTPVYGLVQKKAYSNSICDTSTGLAKTCINRYFGYRITEENGQFTIERSEGVYNIYDLDPDYKYIDPNNFSYVEETMPYIIDLNTLRMIKK